MIDARIADRYVLLAPIGSGGEARVYRARDETSGTEVAVRLALAEVASVISAPPPSSHENWVRYFDSGIDPQHGAYQVFELLEGEDTRRNRQHWPADRRRVARICRGIARGRKCAASRRLGPWRSQRRQFFADFRQMEAFGTSFLSLRVSGVAVFDVREHLHAGARASGWGKGECSVGYLRPRLPLLLCSLGTMAACRRECSGSRDSQPHASGGSLARGRANPPGGVVRLGHDTDRAQAGRPRSFRGSGTSTAGRCSCINAIC